MDPLAVVRALWRYRWYALPGLLLSAVLAGYFLQFGPRSYEAVSSYALVNPDLPSAADMEEDPELAQLNSDNPYLRSSNPTLITDVLLTRLGTATVEDELADRGLSTTYSVARGIGGNGFVIDITGEGGSPEQAQETSRVVGQILEEDLITVQKINGADDRFLFTAILIAESEATERFSSRLRSVIMVFAAGGILVFAGVSLGRWAEEHGPRRRPQGRSKHAKTD